MDLSKGLAGRGAGIDAIEPAVGAVGQCDPPVGGHRADQRRHGIDQTTQTAVAGAQRRLVLLRARQQLVVQVARPLLEQLLLLAQGQQVARPGAELVVVDRAQQEVGRPGLERLIAIAALFVHGHHHHGHVGCARDGAERPSKIGAVHARHLEVGDHQVRHGAADPVQRLLRTGERLDPHPLLDRGGQPRQDVAIGDAIVDHDYVWHEGKSRRSFERHQVAEAAGFGHAYRRVWFPSSKRWNVKKAIATISYARAGYLAVWARWLLHRSGQARTRSAMRQPRPTGLGRSQLRTHVAAHGQLRDSANTFSRPTVARRIGASCGCYIILGSITSPQPHAEASRRRPDRLAGRRIPRSRRERPGASLSGRSGVAPTPPRASPREVVPVPDVAGGPPATAAPRGSHLVN